MENKDFPKQGTQKPTGYTEDRRQTSNLRLRWEWADSTIWTDKMLAALENGVKGGKWFSLIDKVYRPETLRRAWKLVKKNQGAAGVDNVSIEKFEGRAEEYLQELLKELKEETFKPLPVRRVYIPKGDGKMRPLGIPAVKDRIVQAAIKLVVEPIYEQKFCNSSFGFRPGRGAKDALREVDRLIKQGKVWVVDADLQSYFDTIPHDKLMAKVKEDIGDRKVLSLIESFLKQGVLEDMEEWKPTAGTPQGGIISPLLSNLYLHDLDTKMQEVGIPMVRYADDFVILIESEKVARRVFKYVHQWASDNGLTVHPEKSHVGNCLQEGEGFEFLGYRFEAGERNIRRKSLKKLKDKIRGRTRRTCGKSLEMVIGQLNPMLRGWYNYFKHCTRPEYALGRIDAGIRKRLRAILRKQEKRPGRGRSLDDHMRWPNVFFAERGLFSLRTAMVSESASRPR